MSDANSAKLEISAGLNFMQFIDCLGKCGIVAYSGARFRELLPSSTSSQRILDLLTSSSGMERSRRGCDS